MWMAVSGDGLGGRYRRWSRCRWIHEVDVVVAGLVEHEVDDLLADGWRSRRRRSEKVLKASSSGGTRSTIPLLLADGEDVERVAADIVDGLVVVVSLSHEVDQQVIRPPC